MNNSICLAFNHIKERTNFKCWRKMSTQRFIVLSATGVILTASIGIFLYCREYVVNMMNRRPLNEVMASTVIVVDNLDYHNHVASMIEQASTLDGTSRGDDNIDAIPDPIQITTTDPIIAQSCSVYR